MAELSQMERSQKRKSEPSIELRPEEAVHLHVHGQTDSPQSTSGGRGYTPSMEARDLNVATVANVAAYQKPHPPDRFQSMYDLGNRPKEGYGSGKLADLGPLPSRDYQPQHPQDYRQQLSHYGPSNDGYRVPSYTPNTPPFNNDPLSLVNPGANPGNLHPRDLGKRLPSEPGKLQSNNQCDKDLLSI